LANIILISPYSLLSVSTLAEEVAQCVTREAKVLTYDALGFDRVVIGHRFQTI